MKKLTVGILAHVDAGKTTLSEALLYISGKIRSLGRVDHKNTYLDTNAVERERGITIFSKQARFSSKNCNFILLDTPGHVDFSAEAERVLSLLDYAILVISAPDGVQNHTRTLWQLLEHYKVPTFIFVNNTDISSTSPSDIEEELQRKLSPKCISFDSTLSELDFSEKLALVNDSFLEMFLSKKAPSVNDISLEIVNRRLFPCVFGSALRLSGVENLINIIDKYSLEQAYSAERFGARVYKILRTGNQRLTYMKITGGSLSARDEITYISSNGQRISEKISSIRLYSGDKFDQIDTATAGEICAVTGLSQSFVGQGLGFESDLGKPILEPILSYRIILPSDCDPIYYFPKFKELEEEEPSLHLLWNEELKQIEARLMGEIQIDLLKRMIHERFGIFCSLGDGQILYKEKASTRAIGVGHFEPLRHYAEVHLLIEPLPAGSGLVFDKRLPENSLDVNWQRLILSHLYEKNHRGCAIGALLTDTKITLIAGRAHQKHTDGGDFREATLRAVRCGLMKSGCTVLEPYYKFRLEVPSEYTGRALSDLEIKFATFEIESQDADSCIIVGKAPASELQGYMRELISYSKGKGKLSCTSDGYYPCHNEDEVRALFGYNPEADLENPPHSVFCAKGGSFTVPWNEVDSYKHLDSHLSVATTESIIPKAASLARRYSVSDDDLEEIMLREFGPIKRKRYTEPRAVNIDRSARYLSHTDRPALRKMLIIDGYNLIHSWDYLSETAKFSLEKAREALMDMLSSYAAYTKTEITLVFDAYLVEGGEGSDFIKDGYRVVFTKKGETADTFIEKLMHELGPDYTIRLVSSDRLLQYSAVFSGILRMTTKEFEEEVISVGNEITAFIQKLSQTQK